MCDYSLSQFGNTLSKKIMSLSQFVKQINNRYSYKTFTLSVYVVSLSAIHFPAKSRPWSDNIHSFLISLAGCAPVLGIKFSRERTG